jgi:hypothetical protein
LVYFRFKKALHELKPTQKFLVIKAIVFLCWWQGMVVSGMATAGWLDGTTEWTSDEVQRGLQDFLICVEMGIIAMVHHRVYSYLDFVPDAQSETPLLEASDAGIAISIGRAVPTQPSGSGSVGHESLGDASAGKGPVRKPFLEAVANMMPGDVVRDVPRVLGRRQESTSEILVSPPMATGEETAGSAVGDSAGPEL